MLTEGTVLNNRYHIMRMFSDAGGMGLIYQATDLNLGSTVVIKQMRCTESYLRQEYPGWVESSYSTKSQELSQAFVREARLLSSLRHNALPRAIDYFSVEDLGQCFVMEFIPGKDLREMMDEREDQRQGPFPLAQVMEWGDQLLEVLNYLHSHEPPIIHRDLKPSNLKIMPGGQIILLDFGLAKGSVAGMSGSHKSTVGHTPHYAPLEQIHGKGTEPRSDLYALGVTLHQMLTGQMPPDAVERAAETFSGQPDPLRPAHELNPEVPVPVSVIIQRAASLNQNERPASAAAMRQELRQVTRPAAAPMFMTAPIQVVVPAAQPELPSEISDQNRAATIALAEPQAPEQAASQLLVLQSFAEDLGNGVSLEMIALPGGTYLIGSPDGQGTADEHPQFSVSVSPFFIGRFLVTQAQWQAVMGSNPSLFDSSDHPVECVSWLGAADFCRKLSRMTGRNYRLPTEAEWEYACRAGTKTKYSFGDDDKLLGQYAWYDRNSDQGTHPVGRKLPNAWGLHDMIGNVWEWCQDWYGKDYYHFAPEVDPTGPETGQARVLRGGAWSFPGEECRAANRHHFHPISGFDSIGFRVVIPFPPQE
ncbi:MAG TPA: bifunctional serine/threonine-protein kinase/formylglycine-generating enzyme family protein [Blastocatellia bacterium]|nr:bifunctional serine/threonine-protein kinase/formylglycine-generating enzyme family protein [Blastocatellia bacterium]